MKVFGKIFSVLAIVALIALLNPFGVRPEMGRGIAWVGAQTQRYGNYLSGKHSKHRIHIVPPPFNPFPFINNGGFNVKAFQKTMNTPSTAPATTPTTLPAVMPGKVPTTFPAFVPMNTPPQAPSIPTIIQRDISTGTFR
ncbi:MAG: hypothetical protein ACP5O1_12030 [Phycisphaerae bacterium]